MNHKLQFPTKMKYDSAKVVLVVDLVGTFIFGIEGATAAVDGNLDLLGLLVLAFATALAGGIVRDLLIGATPPNAIQDWRYSAAAFAGALFVFFWTGFASSVPAPVAVTIDAAGLALFAVAGAGKALDYGIHPLQAVLMRGITAVGGGTIRDILMARVPSVLQVDVYASAALLGAAVMMIAMKLRMKSTPAMLLGGVVCFVLRLVSVWRHWNLPHGIGR